MKPIKDPFLCVPRSLGVCLYLLLYYKFQFCVVNKYFFELTAGSQSPDWEPTAQRNPVSSHYIISSDFVKLNKFNNLSNGVNTKQELCRKLAFPNSVWERVEKSYEQTPNNQLLRYLFSFLIDSFISFAMGC